MATFSVQKRQHITEPIKLELVHNTFTVESVPQDVVSKCTRIVRDYQGKEAANAAAIADGGSEPFPELDMVQDLYLAQMIYIISGTSNEDRQEEVRAQLAKEDFRTITESFTWLMKQVMSEPGQEKKR